MHFQGGLKGKQEVTAKILAELEDEGFLKIEIRLLGHKDAVQFYTLAVTEEMIRDNYFRPQQKISHHVGFCPSLRIKPV